MRRYLRIVVPVAQVSAVVCTLGWEKLAHLDRTLSFYVLPTRHLLLNLNFPLVIIWWSFIHFIKWLSKYVPFLRQTSGTPAMVGMAAIAFALLSSIALFWYFVVAETQMRSQGKSFMNFSSVILESLKVVILFLCGVGTVFHIYTETMRPFQHGLAHYGLWPVEIALSALLLAAWGATFIGVSIVDFRRVGHP